MTKHRPDSSIPDALAPPPPPVHPGRRWAGWDPATAGARVAANRPARRDDMIAPPPKPPTDRSAPLAPGVPILGNGLDLYRDTLAVFVRCYHELGPIYRLRVPGRRYTVLAGPKANAFLLHGGERHFDSAPVYRRLAQELGTRNYPVATTGERHRHLRRTLRPAFSREAISHYVPRMIEAAGRIARGWQPGQRLRVPEVMRSLLAEQLGLAMANRPIGARLRRRRHLRANLRRSRGRELSGHRAALATVPDRQGPDVRLPEGHHRRPSAPAPRTGAGTRPDRSPARRHRPHRHSPSRNRT